ncbi:MAG TPA: aminotransferase class IV [Acidimicrobiales bacterium]|nr:aminotransferase class IV [Acidimicrobiales bacterium]
MSLVYVNGALVAPENASISVFDHGLVTGDGVFETILLHLGRPFALRQHLARLERSASGLGIETASPEVISSAIEGVIESCDFDKGRIRVIVTSGPGPLGSARGGGSPTLVVAAEPFASGPVANVVVVPWTRNEFGALSGLKTTSYADNALALAYAHEHGADEAIFINTSGMLCEGTGSNIFVVIDGELVTPPLSSGCLDGVTRALVLERHGGHEREVPRRAFVPGSVIEAFLTSTLRSVQPIAAIDGWPLPLVRGPETEKAMASYAALLAEDSEY